GFQNPRPRRGHGFAQMGAKTAVPRLVLHTDSLGHKGGQANRSGGTCTDDRIRFEEWRGEVVFEWNAVRMLSLPGNGQWHIVLCWRRLRWGGGQRVADAVVRRHAQGSR